MATVFMRLSGFKIYRTLIALSMLLASTLGPLAHAKTNEIAHYVAMEDLATTDHSHEHGHNHGLEGSKDHTSNDSHEHNPTDHSHDLPGISTIPGQTALNTFNNRRSIFATSQVDRVSFNIDRPPRF